MATGFVEQPLALARSSFSTLGHFLSTNFSILKLFLVTYYYFWHTRITIFVEYREVDCLRIVLKYADLKILRKNA